MSFLNKNINITDDDILIETLEPVLFTQEDNEEKYLFYLADSISNMYLAVKITPSELQILSQGKISVKKFFIRKKSCFCIKCDYCNNVIEEKEIFLFDEGWTTYLPHESFIVY